MSCHTALSVSCHIIDQRGDSDLDSAQGAAQAVEDGAVLGSLFEHVNDRSQLSDVLAIFEGIRKERTTLIMQGSAKLRNVFHMEDGKQQRERDRRLREARLYREHIIPWANPGFQQWLFGYDAFKEAKDAWRKYEEGKSTVFKKSRNGKL